MSKIFTLLTASFLLLWGQSIAQTINYKINFSDQNTTPPNGWLKDSGLPYGNQNGVTYGWLETDGTTPLDLSNNGRNRPPQPDVNVITETLLHMQYNGSVNGGNSTEGIWAISLPNNTYRVKVQVGDSQFNNSEHVLQAEGTNLLYFTQTNQLDIQVVEKIITVQDGQLVIDAATGTNTKIISVEITDDIPQPQPFVISSIPTDGQTDVSPTTTISANNLNLPNMAGNGSSGVDNATINTNTVQLFEVGNNSQLIRVPGNVNGTGGGDAINFTPSSTLKEFTTYVYRINGVRDLAGFFFEPHEVTFTTGQLSNQQTSLDDVAFTKEGIVASGARYTSLVIGPEGKLYGLTITGYIHRWTINTDGSLGSRQILSTIPNAYGERAAVGLVFDPSSTPTNLIAYVSHCSMELNNAPAWDGKLSRLQGNNLQTEDLLITNLPRSIRDHLVNSLAFQPGNGQFLYFIQSSNTAGGAADNAWGNRPERLLTAAVLRLDLNRLPNNLPIDAKTSMDQNVINNAPANSATTSDGLYNPYFNQAPLTIYATGIRNAYDLYWHSNGQLYIPTNGTAGGSNTPASVNGTRRIDGTIYNYSDPRFPQIPATNQNETQRDWLFRLDPSNPQGYYGHPNPLRGEYVMNRARTDVKKYPNGTPVDDNFRGAAFDFEFNKSPNGVIEYQNSQVFGGALDGALLVVRYSNGDDIIALLPDGPSGDIDTHKELIPGFTGFEDPLDLVEDPNTGNIYVSEYREHQPSGIITLLTPNDNLNLPPIVSFEEPNDGDNFPVGTDLYVEVNASDSDGTIARVELYINDMFVRSEAAPPYEWGDPNQSSDALLQNLQQGTYELRAVAVDNDNASRESIITITVGNVNTGNQPPTVAFVAPQNGADFPVGTDLYVNVNASDSDGQVSKVDLYLDNVLVRAENLAPYEWGDPNQSNDTQLQNLQVGTYALKAVATDNGGASTEETISITVSDQNTPVKDIYFTTPTMGQHFPEGSTVEVRIQAENTSLVQEVSLFVNGKIVRVETDAPYVWGYNSADGALQSMSPGNYEIEAIATYTDATTERETLNITIDKTPNTLPTISFVTPQSNENFPVGTDLYVRVNANDIDGDVKEVTLYLDNQLVRTEDGSPYEWGDPDQSNDIQLQNMAAGTYNLKFVAIDNVGDGIKVDYNITIGSSGGGSTQYGEAIPWVEPFNLANGATTDGAPTSWTATIKNMLNGGIAAVDNEQLKVNGAGVDWSSQQIDVSQVDSVLLSADVQGIGALDNNDEIKLVYRTEGNTGWTLWGRPGGAFPLQTIAKSIDVSGKNFMEIALRIDGLDTDETFLIDNISVMGTTVGGSANTLEERTETVVATEPTFTLLPNPASDWTQLNLGTSQEENLTINIVNGIGRTVWQSQLTAIPSASPMLDVSSWASGTYFVYVSGDNGVQQSAVLVVK
ncbi:MAG: Ig-like domain-containing protein [Bacteroidota bacterium]